MLLSFSLQKSNLVIYQGATAVWGFVVEKSFSPIILLFHRLTLLVGDADYLAFADTV
jgi:hypothetical protein